MSDASAHARTLAPSSTATLAAAEVILPPGVRGAIERLRLSSEIQDLTGLPKPVAFTSVRRERAARRVVAAIKSRRPRANRFAAVDGALLRALRLLAVGRRGWRRPETTITTEPMPKFAGYVTSSRSEDQVVRLSLLLRLMRRRKESIDLLAKRLRSGLPADQSRFWLSHLLLHGGEKRAAAALAAEGPAEAGPHVRSGPAEAGPHVEPSRLRYAIVMLTMFDTPVFRSSLRSLVNSDYPGTIVVVEDGYEPGETCREFCADLPVTYIKRREWTGSAAAMNEGISAVADDTDVVMFAHNDILWPVSWFSSFNRGWDAVFDTGRVGLLNLGYLQFKHKLEATLTELFLRGEYDHLQWILTASRDVAWLKSDRIQDSQAHGGDRLFGMARDPWNDWTPDVRFMTGRFSIGASFPVSTWRAIGGFDPRLAYGFDVELQHYCVTNRKWMLFTNNPPLIHLASSDTRSVDRQRRAATLALHDTLPVFEEKYGWQLEHFLNVYFSESAFIYQDQIVRAANSGRFDDIDFVFDDFQERLRTRTLQNCELTWCRSRSTCAYSAKAKKVATR